MISVKFEDITPKAAHDYLSRSVGNRALNTNYVLSLAVAMESGRWTPEASEIVLDESGALIDGHHRLHAVVALDSTVKMLVKRGVPKAARGVIDTGRPRSMNDLFTMFRPGATNVTLRRAALNTCVALLASWRRPPLIRTLDAFDAWETVFASGIDTILPMFASVSTTLRSGLSIGAFAFAHKTDPKRVETFVTSVIDGVGLERGSAALTLRNMLTGQSSRTTGHDRAKVSRKILSGVYADLKGLPWAKAQDGAAGVEFFRKAYEGRNTERLLKLWSATPDAVKADAA